MKVRLKHLGYGLLLVTAFFNFWFYRFNLHQSFSGGSVEIACSHLNPCLDNGFYRVDVWQGWAESGWTEDYADARSVEIGYLQNIGFHLQGYDYQIFWMQMFMTAMFDTLAVSFALALMLHPANNNK